MKLSLVVLTAGKASGQSIPITLAQFIIGRDPQCNLRPTSPVISKRHCAILSKGGKVVLRDLDSTNGTFVNDKQLKGECQLNNGDVLKVGPLSFRVSIEVSTPVNKPTPPPPKLAAAAATADDDVAAMLLELQDDTGTSTEAVGTDPEVPDGSTVMDMVPLGAGAKPGSKDDLKKHEPKKEEAAKEPAAKEAASKEAPGKTTVSKEAPKPSSGDARSAAAAILQKYTRRDRT